MTENPKLLTPMMRQYLEIKQNYQDAILFFRMGDFYEMFFEDAKLGSQLLEIALTSRNKGESDSIPFCGIPHHAASSYIARLIQAGHKVAICEQVEDPSAAKGIVRREVIRVITPGLVLETESLEAKNNNFLVSLATHHQQFGFSWVDISTGEMGVGFFADEEALISEISRREPRELLCATEDVAHPILSKIIKNHPRLLVQGHDQKETAPTLLSFFSKDFQNSWTSLSLKNTAPLVEQAALRLLHYIRETLKKEVHHLSRITWRQEKGHLLLDATTVRNLELIRNLQDGSSWATLFYVLDRTQTTMGTRRLKNWVLYPLNDLDEIQTRLEGIGELIQRADLFGKIKDTLHFIVDLERQNGRIATQIAHARDLLSLGLSLQKLPQLRTLIEPLKGVFFKRLLSDWTDLNFLADKIVSTLSEDPPLALKEGGLIRAGVLPELDELRAIAQDGKTILLRMEENERKKTGITSLKIRYNRVFGYYIEVPQARIAAVPADYIRKQTLANAERYITPELKVYEDKVLGAEERIRQLEYEHFSNLRFEVAQMALEISRMAGRIADLDALQSLACVAQENNYACPEFVAGEEYVMEEGRHPVLEKIFPSSRFIPNDVTIGVEDCRLMLLTGPNMAGKSTILRQVALIALMAHMGSYVPAKRVRLGLIDRIFTRIGASDHLAKNQSTFWVEMEETAQILKSATPRSLIVLDEIGRGTSTYDGLSVAWAVAEHLHDSIRAKALFATHYHELTRLADEKPALQNFHIAVKEWNGEIIFLYRLLPGATSRSYGIQVAALAGIPSEVIARAKQVLEELQNEEVAGEPPHKGAFHPTAQLPLFSSSESPLIEEVRKVSLDHLSPMEALQFLYALQKKTTGS